MPPPRRESSSPRPVSRGKQIIQLRQLHLQLAFAGARVHGENIQDQLRAVNHAGADALLHIAQLHGSEIVVHDHQRDVAQLGFGANFVELAAADERGGIERFAHLQHAAGNFRAGAFGQLVQFFQRIAPGSRRITRASARRFFQADADEQHAFAIVHGLRSFHEDRVGPGRVRSARSFIHW